MGANTLPLPIPNPPAGAAGPIALPPATLLYFVTTAPAFSQLTAQVLGNAGDPSDGFDADFLALLAFVATLDQGAAAGDVLLAALDGPLSDVLALGDDVAALMLAGTAIADSYEAPVGQLLIGGFAPWAFPALISLLPIPPIPSLVAPALVDVTALLQGLVTGVVQSFETGIENQITGIYNDIQDIESTIFQDIGL